MRKEQKNQLAFSNLIFHLPSFIRNQPCLSLRQRTILLSALPSSTTSTTMKLSYTQSLLDTNTSIRVPFARKRYKITRYCLCWGKSQYIYNRHVFVSSLSTFSQKRSCNIVQLVNSIRQDIYKQKLLTSETELLVTFSGGQDSICSLFVLFLLQNQMNISFDSICMNHFWQKSSFFTMLHATKCAICFCSSIKLFIPLNTVTTHQVHSEQKARNWRHWATQRAAIFYDYTVWTQGHSKSDRVETILFNLIRGAGMPGVSALHWKKTQNTFFSNKYYPNLLNFVEQTHLTLPSFKSNEKHI